MRKKFISIIIILAGLFLISACTDSGSKTYSEEDDVVAQVNYTEVPGVIAIDYQDNLTFVTTCSLTFGGADWIGKNKLNSSIIYKTGDLETYIYYKDFHQTLYVNEVIFQSLDVAIAPITEDMWAMQRNSSVNPKHNEWYCNEADISIPMQVSMIVFNNTVQNYEYDCEFHYKENWPSINKDNLISAIMENCIFTFDHIQVYYGSS